MSDVELCAELLKLCGKWDLPLGPFLTQDDIDDEMVEFAEKLGPKSAAQVAECLKVQESSSFEHIVVLCEFVSIYMRRFPTFVVSLLQQIDASGPPIVVEFLGLSKAPGVSQRLIEVIDLKVANEDLQISFLGALRNLRDDAAIDFLYSLDESIYSEKVRNVIAIAKHSLNFPPVPSNRK